MEENQCQWERTEVQKRRKRTEDPRRSNLGNRLLPKHKKIMPMEFEVLDGK